MTTPSSGWARPTPGWTTPTPVWTDVNPADLYMAATVLIGCARRLSEISDAAEDLTLRSTDFSLLAGPGPAVAYHGVQHQLVRLLNEGASTCTNTSTELVKAAVLYTAVEQENTDRMRRIW